MVSKVSKRFILLAAICGIGLVAMLLWLWPREPVYQGRPVSVWLRELANIGSGRIVLLADSGGARAQFLPDDSQSSTKDQVASSSLVAIRAMGTNALPCLLDALRKRDSPWRVRLNAWLGRFPRLKARFPTANASHFAAMCGLIAVGTNAVSVLPEVASLSRQCQIGSFDIFAEGLINRLASSQGFESVTSWRFGSSLPAVEVLEKTIAAERRFIVFSGSPKKYSFVADGKVWCYLLTPEGKILDAVKLTVHFDRGSYPFVWSTRESGPETLFLLCLPDAINSARLWLRHGHENYLLRTMNDYGEARGSDDEAPNSQPRGVHVRTLPIQQFWKRGPYLNRTNAIELILGVSKGHFKISDADWHDIRTASRARNTSPW